MGSNSVWGVKSDGGVIVRMGICSETPLGKDWVTVDGEPMKQVIKKLEVSCVKNRQICMFGVVALLALYLRTSWGIRRHCPRTGFPSVSQSDLEGYQINTACCACHF